MPWKKLKESIWLEMAALTAISVFVYLVHIRGFSYYRDDWYYMYDGMVGGGKVFVEMFRHLRPARGPLFEGLFGLFGTNPLPYHVLLYLWRLIGGFGALWLFRILWPKQRTATFFMALLFLVYPGFLWWVQGFEYQPMVMSVGLQIFSVIFTLQAVQSISHKTWLLWMLASLFTGWTYLAFVEYAIGMEFFRWLCVYLLIGRASERTLFQKMKRTARAVAVPILIPALFLLWRIFLFDNERKAADISLQTGAMLSSPGTILWWLIHFFQSALNVSVFAWTSPFNSYFYLLRLKDIALVAGLAAVVLAITYFANKLTTAEEQPGSTPTWQLEAMAIGVLGVGAGVFPIIIANRVVTLERFSHYALPSSIAAVTLAVGLIYLTTDSRIRVSVLTLLVGLATLTHGSVALKAVEEERLIQEFWHQVAWRVPEFEPGSLLIVNFPFGYADDADIVYGPANFIYYPDEQAILPIRLAVNAVAIQPDSIRNILVAKLDIEKNFFGAHIYRFNYKNVLVLTWPSPNYCVRILDGQSPSLSLADPDWVVAVAGKSRNELIATSGLSPLPPEFLFGPEPAHDWCFYYQKADLARQQGDWDEVMSLGDQAARLSLHPNDPIEWLPFLQAYIISNKEEDVKRLSTIINTEAYYKREACQMILVMESAEYQIPPNMKLYSHDLFCFGK